MKRIGMAVAALVIGAGAPSAAADSLTCGTEYVTAAGDSVHLVAAKAYGPGLHRQLMVNILFQRYRQKAGVFEEGTVIMIPCATANGFDLPASYWSTSSQNPLQVAIRTAGYDRQSVDAASGLPPLFSALIDEAMRIGQLAPDFHELGQQSLIAYRPFPISEDGGDVSYPWMAADCSESEGRARKSGALCAGSLWSDPIFEVTSAVYLSATGGGDDYSTARLCIADESRAAVLASSAQAGSDPDAAMAGTVKECIALLRRGRIGAIIAPDVLVAQENRRNPPSQQLRRVSEATYSDTVHAVISRKNPAAKRILQRLNDGIEEIRTSGAWYRIVHAQLTRQLMN